MKTVVVYNAKSGSALSKNELKRLFSKHNIVVEKYIDITTGFPQNLQPFITKKCIVAAIGGDGTLSSVANEIIGSKAIFAPLPGGTLNHFTKDLKIPQDLDVAVQNITKKSITKVDVATINNTVFLNNSSLGIYPVSLEFRNNMDNKLGKWPAAVAGILKALFHYKLYTISVHGSEFKTPFIFIGNNDYHLTDITNVGRKSLSQGVLSIYTVKTGSRLEILKQLFYMITGRSDMVTKIETWTAQSITIHTKRTKISVSRDGELQQITSPLKYELHADALNVIV